MFGGDESLAVVAHPTRVEAYWLGSHSEGVDSLKATLSDYPITFVPVKVPAAVGADLARVLTSAESDNWDSYKGCRPRPGVAVSFHRPSGRIDVLLCFECNILLVARDASIIGDEDFDDIRPILMRSIKPLFPKDAVVQSLGENR
jgi:hypothetical protein